MAAGASNCRRRVVRLDIEYEGTDFRGFALQPGERTVAGVLGALLAPLFGEPVRLIAGGRTDSGVHAQGQVVSFETGSSRPVDVVHKALNAQLDDDIRILRVQDADSSFDARRCAIRRRYRYCIWNSPEVNVWERRVMLRVPEPLDVSAMQEACQELVGRHDFAAFWTHQSQDDMPITTTRRVFEATWNRDDKRPVVEFTVEADAYLRHMVRVMVGSSIEVGLGRRPVQSIGAMLRAKQRPAAGPTAPARGLTLMQIRYPVES